jgi:hypothetical protein
LATREFRIAPGAQSRDCLLQYQALFAPDWHKLHGWQRGALWPALGASEARIALRWLVDMKAWHETGTPGKRGDGLH